MRLAEAELTDHDRLEVEHFTRFLELAGPAPLPGENSGFLKVYRGWLPYVLGHFFFSGVWGPHERSLAPPEGYDDIPVTAWTMPG